MKKALSYTDSDGTGGGFIIPVSIGHMDFQFDLQEKPAKQGCDLAIFSVQ